MIQKREPLSFIRYLKKYIPTRSRLDAGVDFNLIQVHHMIEEYLKEQETEDTLKDQLDKIQTKLIMLRYDLSFAMEKLK